MSWPGGKRLAVFVNVAFEGWGPGTAPGISPMGNPLPSGLLDTQARSWGEYGSRRGIWRLLEILERRQVTATVMASAIFAETAPKALRAVADAGHEVCAHAISQDVIPVALSESEERAQIVRCRDLLAEACGVPPQGWISPRGTPSPQTAALLAETGFMWFGDCFDDDEGYVETYGEHRVVVHLPLTMEVNDLPLRMRHGQPPAAFEDIFVDSFEAARTYATDLMHLDVTVHAHVSGRPVGAQGFERVLDRLVGRDDIWVATRAAAATHILRAEGHTS